MYIHLILKLQMVNRKKRDQTEEGKEKEDKREIHKHLITYSHLGPIRMAECSHKLQIKQNMVKKEKERKKTVTNQPTILTNKTAI